VLVDQSMAAMLESGSVATLNYANKVVAMILGISSMAIGTAVLPHFSRLIASENWSEVRYTFRTYTRLIIMVTIPATLILFYLSEPITKLLFERGAFTSQDTQLVAQTQAYYLLQLPFYVLGILGVRLISAMAKNKVLMHISFVNLIINIIGNYFFMQYLGVAGIALSTAIVYALSTGIVFFYLTNKRVFKCT
jgi:putative peptidoglycan lipid II flippase